MDAELHSINNTTTMLGSWDKWYRGVTHIGHFRYGNTPTYQLAADFLEGLEVEDWGCGLGGYKLHHKGDYIGVDGSETPVVSRIRDLRFYKSSPEGIMMRHILEHNYDWRLVLANALTSFRKRMVLVLFTPFQEETKEIKHNKAYGVDVPDIGFKREDIEQYFTGLKWRSESLPSATSYKQEHIYFLEK